MFAALPQVMMPMVANYGLCCLLSQTRQAAAVWMTGCLIEQVGQRELENEIRQARCCFAGEESGEYTFGTFMAIMASVGSVHVEKLTEQGWNQE